MPDRVERLTNLLALLLSTHEPLTLEQINDRLQAYPEGEAGRRAFERDKDVLRSEGVPITTEQIEGGGPAGAYRVRAEDYYLPDLSLTDDERVALHLALAGVRFESGWERVVRWTLGEVDVDSAPPLAALPAADALPAVFDGCRQRAQMTFDYHGEQRTFRVDRIEGRATVGAPGAFEAPPGFDPGAALPEDPKLIGGDEAVEAEVEVDGVQAAKVVMEQGEDAVVTTRGDGSIVVRLRVTNRPAFRSWLLGLRDHAEVLGPPDLRTYVVDWLEATARSAGRGAKA